ncbi:glucose-1-phosphate thymidylyltransferase [Nitrosopumilus adriaticus]|uniref:Glucose-1-phosphate thymidyltransferase n=1 Tax=Nitrosopumilus adriaticus TaxID=1580092 RepID=A0A0D5C4V0_9ARCH|nr:glucose-1-phosphate thymidylyltransferase [Nitrosopumilus adriaticus]AJW71814.1 Glucose-1-phosphate thymidyltransferase [Nitrosopumilus adriaticus]
MKGIILHGGHGTRLRPLTHTGPKQLLPIANKPMSQYCVEALVQAGIIDIAIVIGGIGSNKVKEYYGNGEKFGAKFSYIEQDYPKGISHAISLCQDFIKNEKFVVFLGDNIIQNKINEYVSNFQSSNAEASLLLCEVNNPSQFGVAEIKDKKIVNIVEKPKNPTSNLVVTGIYFLTPYIFEIIKKLKPSWRNELEIADALQMLIDEKREIIYEIITDFWKDTGTPIDIIDANKTILENMRESFQGKKEGNVFIEGKVLVGKGTIIKNNVKIKGPTIIGDDCIIDENTTIGENTSIGDNSHLSNCIVSNSIIMSDCTIVGKMNINQSIIASNSKILRKQGETEKKFLLGEGTQIFI